MVNGFLSVGGIGEFDKAADFSGGGSFVNDTFFRGLVDDRLGGIQLDLGFFG